MLDAVLRLFVGCFTSVRLGYCFTPYQRLWLYKRCPFSRLLRYAGDTEDVFST